MSGYLCEKENACVIVFEVVNEASVDERQICRTIAMKTWGDDGESRSGKHLWPECRPVGVSKTCPDAGRGPLTFIGYH